MSGEPMPLVTALQAAALAADVQLVVAGVPVGEVLLPVTSSDWRGVLFSLAAAFGLRICELSPGTVLVSASEHAGVLCGEEWNEAAVVAVEALAAPREDDAPAPEAVVIEPRDEALVYRVRVLQLDETRALDIGLDWSGGVFETAARLLTAGAQVSQGVWPSGVLGDVVRFLESEGVAMRLDDVELRSIEGRSVAFNRGGTIAVNLVGSGGASISERFQYGLGLQLTGVVNDGDVELSYSFTDSAPSNISDPANVQLASTTSSSLVRVPCGHGVVLAAIGTQREGVQGSGLPVLASVPVAGYVAGVGGFVSGRTSFVVTVDVGCGA